MGVLQNKVALVTGASKGIGAAIAEQFAKEGASVVVNYASSKSDADAVVKRITDAGGKAVAIQANVAKEAEVKKLLEETKSAFGKLDVLVNNAGVYEFSPLEAITPEHFHKQFDINVLGLLLTTREAVKLVNGNGASVINISSVVSQMPVPNAAVYSATKAAVDAATIALATELGPKGIRVNAINPGMIETEGVRSAGFAESDFRKQLEAKTPLQGRIGTAEEIARIAVFYASNDASWVTGQTLLAAGGMRG